LAEGETLSLLANPEKRVVVLRAYRGPFVMNTEKETEQAIRDYRNGTLTHYREIGRPQVRLFYYAALLAKRGYQPKLGSPA